MLVNMKDPNATCNSDFGDSFSAKGSVKKVLIDKSTGEIVKEWVTHNLIVKIGRSQLIRMLAGETTSSITKMSVGSGGTADTTTNAYNPIPPTDADTGLRRHVYATDITSRNVDLSKTNPQVTFIALFDCVKVDSLVNESGLLFNDETTLFARHTFDTVPLKTSSNFSLQISWTIEF